MGDRQPHPDDPAVDLFDRWLANRGDQPVDLGETDRVPSGPIAESDAPPTSGAAPRRAEAPRRRKQPEPRLVRFRQRPGLTPAKPAAAAAPSGGRTPPPERGPSNDVAFTPRTGTRRLVGFVVLATLVATGGATYLAFTEPTTLTIGVAVTLGLLTFILWGIRAGSPVATLEVKGGQLIVDRGGVRSVFDLSSRYTPIEIVGKPGERTWKVLLQRPGQGPFVVDSSVVDPREFTEALLRYRPDAGSHQ